VAKYSADIEIAVRGGQQVDGLIKNLNRLNNSINVVNRNAKLLEGKGFNVASMENYSRAVLKAENAIRKAAQGTQQEQQAVRSLVTAMDAENKARARRNFLISQEIASRRQVIATANAGFGVQGPQAAAVRAGRGPASPIRGTVNMPGSPAALAAAGGGGTSGGRGISGRLGGAISGSIIGGAFPLLFGQGGGAAAGGAIGGLVGGLAGPGGSFAGSLLGTLLGDIASRGQAVKQLAEDIGFSAQQTKQLSDAFKVANTDVEKFTAVIQNIRGVGLELEDQAKAIQLVTTLTEKYGGSFEKTGNAITSALEAGKVTQATLNQLTSQGINIQQALADKYNVNRDALLQMAKDGKISVQSLIDTLVDLGNEPGKVAKQTQTASEQFQTAIQNLTKVVGPELERLGKLFANFGATALNALNNVLTRLGQAGTAIENAIAGETLKNAQEQFKRDSQKLKQLYATPKGQRSKQDIQQITALEVLQKGRLATINAAKPQTPPKLETFTAPSQLPPSGGTSGADKAAREAERLAEQQQKQLETAARLAVLADTQLQKAVAVTDAEKINADYILKRMERMTKYESLYRDALSSAETEYLVMAQTSEIIAEKLEYEKEMLDIALKQSEIINATNPLATLQEEINFLDAKVRGKEQEYIRQKAIEDLVSKGVVLEDAIAQVDVAKQLNVELQKRQDLEQLIGTIGRGVGDSLMNVLDGLIDKTQSLNSVLRNTLAGLGRFLMMAGLNMWADAGDPAGKGTGVLSFLGFGKGFGKRASGGPVTASAPYLVGERGPELFLPSTGGNVMSNNDLRSAMGSSSAGGGAPVLNMSFQTTNIGGVEYVSRDQLEQAMAATRRAASRDGAKRGMSMTLDKLQQSPSTRNRVGLR